MGQPKALLRFHGKTFLERILDVASGAGIGHTVVVVGHHQREITESINLSHVVFNTRYEEGMSTSVQAGIQGLPTGTSAVVLFLVDHPLVSPAVVRQLLGQVEPGRIILPVFQGRRGHPIVLPSDLFPEVLALDSTQGLNVVVRRDPARIKEVPIADAGVLVDVDTPEQFEKLLTDSE